MKTPSTSTKFVATGAVALLTLAYFNNAKAIDMSWLWPITGSGVVVKQAHPLDPFTAMKIHTRASVDIHLGAAPSAQLEVDDNIASHVQMTVRDGTLYIEDGRNFKPTVFRITIEATQLDRIATGETAAVRAVGLHGADLSVSVGGSSAVTLRDLRVGMLKMDLGDKGVLHAAGTATRLAAVLGGSSALAADDLDVQVAVITSGGASQASVWAKDNLAMTLGGSAAVRYFGEPKVALTSGGSAVVTPMGPHPATAVETQE